MKSAFFSGNALDNEAGVLIDKDAHFELVLGSFEKRARSITTGLPMHKKKVQEAGASHSSFTCEIIKAATLTKAD